MNMEEARDAMFAGVAAILPSVSIDPSRVNWPDLPFTIPTSGPWVRVALRHEIGKQSSLTGGLNKTKWEKKGILFIQVFTPIGDGLNLAYRISEGFVNGFQDLKVPELWFRNARAKEVDPDGAFSQFNVMVDFTYTEIR